MSDFDKEAEREKLREKYERDKQEREATQRMSDLLLKGARMTNTHCNTCGDPLFQQNGTTFCPSCHGSAEGVEASAADQSAGQDTRGDDASGGEPAAPDSGTVDTADTAPSTDESGSADAPESPAGSTDVTSAISNDRASSPHVSPAQPQDEPNETATRSPDSRAEPAEPSQAPASGRPARDRAGDDRSSPVAVNGDIETARDALVESLERFARKAAETDDPRYAKDCLDAAREASEALSALR